jgi:hypothetical protein
MAALYTPTKTHLCTQEVKSNTAMNEENYSLMYFTVHGNAKTFTYT